MIEIWIEFARFIKTNQRRADQVRIITKNGWFSDLEILDIHQQIYWQTYQQTPNIETKSLTTEESETPNQTLNDQYTANTKSQTLTQKEKNECRSHEKNHVWKENPIAFSQEPRLKDSQIRNWESKHLFDKYPNKHHIINDLIYAGAKLVCEKIGIPLKTTDRKSTPG